MAEKKYIRDFNKKKVENTKKTREELYKIAKDFDRDIPMPPPMLIKITFKTLSFWLKVAAIGGILYVFAIIAALLNFLIHTF
jgi:hypothetical protein